MLLFVVANSTVASLSMLDSPMMSSCIKTMGCLLTIFTVLHCISLHLDDFFKEMFTLARCRENDFFDSVGLSYLYGGKLLVIIFNSCHRVLLKSYMYG